MKNYLLCYLLLATTTFAAAGFLAEEEQLVKTFTSESKIGLLFVPSKHGIHALMFENASTAPGTRIKLKMKDQIWQYPWVVKVLASLDANDIVTLGDDNPCEQVRELEGYQFVSPNGATSLVFRKGSHRRKFGGNASSIAYNPDNSLSIQQQFANYNMELPPDQDFSVFAKEAGSKFTVSVKGSRDGEELEFDQECEVFKSEQCRWFSYNIVCYYFSHEERLKDTDSGFREFTTHQLVSKFNCGSLSLTPQIPFEGAKELWRSEETTNITNQCVHASDEIFKGRSLYFYIIRDESDGYHCCWSESNAIACFEDFHDDRKAMISFSRQ